MLFRSMNDARPWRVGIRDPRAVRTLAWLELNDESVATSGDYERFFLVNGKRIHHLLDPRTGRPAGHTIAVTVIANDATLADAASTALFIAGPDQWQNVARAMGVDQALRVDASGQIQVTRKLQARLQLHYRIAANGVDHSRLTLTWQAFFRAKAARRQAQTNIAPLPSW